MNESETNGRGTLPFTAIAFSQIFYPWKNHPLDCPHLCCSAELLGPLLCHYGLFTDQSPSCSCPKHSPGLIQPCPTGDESPVPLPVCGTHPIVQQQSIWHLYRVISETINEWKCMVFVKVLTPFLEAPAWEWRVCKGVVGKSLQLTMSPSPYSSACLWPRRRQMAGWQRRPG